MGMLIYIVAIVGMMYFFMIRPARKQQQQRQELMNSVAVGDKVVMISGLHGVVHAIDASLVTINCEGIFLEFERTSIARVLKDTAAEDSQACPEEEEAKGEEVETSEQESED
ncbi:preprotein translocase subunit YajC [Aerococcus christensenii]|uniref:preprotein translocase subunit YajC n=1 Tax=Aerococcus christensenii TaxID=87541 RepID=UPI0007632ADB|nr:preprotein translocase subunit YajC [Aerococcus christensenii]AMB92683.1 hypothetical protein AWM71_05065 [Aerococcus christensenii]